MRMILIAVLALAVSPAAAEAPPPSDQSDLLKWLGAQQKYAGTALSLHRDKYALTWWDAVSMGQSGLNVGKADALDYLDIGPSLSVANQRNPRYGLAVPIHVGNIWNRLTGRLPAGIASHVYFASLPNVAVAPIFLWPDGRPLGKWYWTDDFQVGIAYKFGGP